MITIDDLKPGASFQVEDGMTITPSIVTVHVNWIDSQSVYYTKPPLRSIRQTSIERFLEIVNHAERRRR